MKESRSIPSKKFASVIILASTSFAWLFIFFDFFRETFQVYITDTGILYNGYFLFLGVAAFSALMGSAVSEKINRRKFLVYWIIVGLIANVSLLFIHSLGTTYFFLISVILGISIGFGFPSCLGFLADSTTVEERARTSGIMVLVTLVIVIFSFVFAAVTNYGLGLFVLLCVLRASSLLAFVLDDCPRPTGKIRSWVNVLTSKDYFLYLFPWLMFSFTGSLIDLVFRGLTTPEYESIGLLAGALHFSCWAVFGLLSGILGDRLGRKQPIVIGLVMLGVGFALLSLIISPITVLVYYAFSGVAWGFLFTVYISVLGDLASYGSKEKFYAMGAIMPLILMLGFSALTSLLNVTLSGAIVPVLSIILFLSVLPVLRASETLPQKKQEARKLKDHMDKVRKVIEESRKEQSS
jgi:MFS family permease